MSEQFSRTELIFGKESMQKLSAARVAVFGVGGVGGYVVEALVRSGIGTIDIIDDDKVCLSNLNRQIIATQSTVGKYKVDVAEERIHDINPDCKVNKFRTFYLPEEKDKFDFSRYDYVVDAIDTVSGKIGLVMQAEEAGVPIISSMGAGNKVDPTAFEVTDIYKTSVDPLAKVMRRELKKRGIKKLKVVYSREIPMTQLKDEATEAGVESCGENNDSAVKKEETQDHSRRSLPGSNAFVPSVAGLIIAGEVIKDITGVRSQGLGN